MEMKKRKRKTETIISTSGCNFCTSRRKTKTKHRTAKPEIAPENRQASYKSKYSNFLHAKNKTNRKSLD